MTGIAQCSTVQCNLLTTVMCACPARQQNPPSSCQVCSCKGGVHSKDGVHALHALCGQALIHPGQHCLGICHSAAHGLESAAQRGVASDCRLLLDHLLQQRLPAAKLASLQHAAECSTVLYDMHCNGCWLMSTYGQAGCSSCACCKWVTIAHRQQ